MTAEKYVKKIVKKVMCGKEKKADIQKQLLAEIYERELAGENLKNIISQMGTINEIAENFNETMSDADKKNCKKRKLCRIITIVALIVVIIFAFLYWMSPKVKDLDQSKVFDKNEVENVLMQMITDLEEGNYTELRAKATPKLQKIMTEETMNQAKGTICDNWGSRQQVGKLYQREIVQMGKHLVINQVTISYENVNVVYTITIDRNLKIAGLFIK